MKAAALLFAILPLLAVPATPLNPAPPNAATVALRVVGRVTDGATGRPLGGAQVSVSGASPATLSRADGRYLLVLDDGWVGRRVTLRASLPGYGTVTRTLVLSAGDNVVAFTLPPAGLALESKVLDAVGRGQPRAPVASVAAGLAPGGRVFNTESYQPIEENEFRSPGVHPLSTFSIDVDRASYANVRRFLRQGVRPPVDAVRVEELVNYFPYEDAGPGNDTPFAVHTEVAAAPWQPLHRLVRIGLQARSVDLEDLPPSNLVFLVDVSGSMQPADKLPLLKSALRMLVDQLRPRDRVAVVVYAGAAGLVLPPTPGSRKTEILAALAELEAGGSTAGGAGLELAYRVAAENHVEGGNNRVILATDGDFNVGPSSDAEMVRLIEAKREQGTFLTVLGFGTGNLKDSKMEQLADRGNGNFAYIDNALEARKVLVHEMGGTLLTVAKDVKVQVEFNPARVAAYRLVGYENRLLAPEDFDDDTKDAGEMGAGHTVTALYEVVPAGVESPVETRGVDPLRYGRDVPPPTPAADSGELLFVKVRYKEPDGAASRLVSRPVPDAIGEPSENLRFAAAVAAWGMILRDSEQCEGFTLDDVERLARSAMDRDREGYRAEFVSLVAASRTILDAEAPAGGGR